MEGLSILTNGDKHHGLKAGLEEKTVSRHCAASATVRWERKDISISIRRGNSRILQGVTSC